MNIQKNSENNTYYFSISLGRNNITGKRRQTRRTGFKTKKEAEIEYNRLLYKYHNKELEKKHIEISFEELINIFSEKRVTEIKHTTWTGETGKIKTHILPYFKTSKIAKLTRQDILDFQEHLIHKKLSTNSVNKILLTLKQIFDFAIENQFLEFNHCLSIKSLKVERPIIEFWTSEEFMNYIAYVKENEEQIYYVLFTFAYLTGARLSEILGCRWQDINFTTQTWRINYGLHYSQTKGYYLDTPKTKTSSRSISLNNRVVEMLREYQKTCTLETDFVFAFNDIYPQRNIILKKFYSCIKESGSKKIRFHDLRHSHVALLINMEEHDFVIKERMGHSSIRITYDIYGHLFPTKQRELAQRLDNLFEKV